MSKFLKTSFYSLVVFLGAYGLTSAQSGGVPTGSNPGGVPTGSNPGSNGGQTLVNPLRVNDLQGLLNLVLDAVIRIGTIVLVLMLVWVGFLFVAARGNEEKLRTARTAFFWTIIGGLILLGARGIASVIQSTGNALGT